jgi:LysW-gamma-L-lysine carboxypeptidase
MSTVPAAGRTPDDVAAVSLLEQSVCTPSVSTREAQMASLLRGTAARWGMATSIDVVGNAHARAGHGTGPVIMLVGHMDTVPGDLDAGRRGDVIHGRGSVDAKASLVAMLTAAARCADLEATVLCVGAVEEEMPSSRGAEHLRISTTCPDALIVGEPSGWSGVTLGYKGKVDVVYSVDTPAGHPARPGDKASELAVRFLAAVLNRFNAAGNQRFADVGLAVPMLSGDCEHTSCELSFRTPAHYPVGDLVRWLGELAGPGHIAVVNIVGAVQIRRSDPVVQALSSAIRGCGGTPIHKLKSGTSDMNTLAAGWDIPMATYGPGDSSLDHSDTEHIHVDEFLRGVTVLETAIRALAHRLPASQALRPTTQQGSTAT